VHLIARFRVRPTTPRAKGVGGVARRRLKKQRAREVHTPDRRADLAALAPVEPGKPLRIRNALVHIGTSGWHYKHWLGDFYPQRFPPAKMLEWYAREFQTVEINNSFYRLPEEKTFEQWRKTVPRGFLFSVKASRFLTHLKRLKDPEDSITLFFSRAEHLGPSLGPILFQLPPRWKADAGRLRAFLEALPPKHEYAMEFRDESWYSEEICELLHHHNVALCLHDWRSADWVGELTASFTYIRFHGTNGRYAGNYPDEKLRHFAKQIQRWGERLSDVFVYFNNDIGGHAIRNARSLRVLLAECGVEETNDGVRSDA
jgi:uncharacterized protein YecE (DUF72 family)